MEKIILSLYEKGNMSQQKSIKNINNFIFFVQRIYPNALRRLNIENIPKEKLNKRMRFLQSTNLANLITLSIEGETKSKIELDILRRFIELPNIEEIKILGCYLIEGKIETQRFVRDQREELKNAIRANTTLKKFIFVEVNRENVNNKSKTYQIIFRAFSTHKAIQHIKVQSECLSGCFWQILELVRDTKTLQKLQINSSWSGRQFLALLRAIEVNTTIKKIYENMDYDLLEIPTGKYIAFFKSLKSSSLTKIDIVESLDPIYGANRTLPYVMLKNCPKLNFISFYPAFWNSLLPRQIPEGKLLFVELMLQVVQWKELSDFLLINRQLTRLRLDCWELPCELNEKQRGNKNLLHNAFHTLTNLDSLFLELNHSSFNFYIPIILDGIIPSNIRTYKYLKRICVWNILDDSGLQIFFQALLESKIIERLELKNDDNSCGYQISIQTIDILKQFLITNKSLKELILMLNWSLDSQEFGEAFALSKSVKKLELRFGEITQPAVLGLIRGLYNNSHLKEIKLLYFDKTSVEDGDNILEGFYYFLSHEQPYSTLRSIKFETMITTLLFEVPMLDHLRDEGDIIHENSHLLNMEIHYFLQGGNYENVILKDIRHKGKCYACYFYGFQLR